LLGVVFMRWDVCVLRLFPKFLAITLTLARKLPRCWWLPEKEVPAYHFLLIGPSQLTNLRILLCEITGTIGMSNSSLVCFRVPMSHHLLSASGVTTLFRPGVHGSNLALGTHSHSNLKQFCLANTVCCQGNYTCGMSEVQCTT